MSKTENRKTATISPETVTPTPAQNETSIDKTAVIDLPGSSGRLVVS